MRNNMENKDAFYLKTVIEWYEFKLEDCPKFEKILAYGMRTIYQGWIWGEEDRDYYFHTIDQIYLPLSYIKYWAIAPCLIGEK